MKLVSQLPERPGFLHAMPVFDLFALVLLFFLLGPSFVLQSGIRVDPPPSRFQLERFEETLVVSILSGATDAGPEIYFGRERVTPGGLRERLAAIKEDGLSTRAMVLLKSDANTPVRFEREIAESILSAGFNLALAGAFEEDPPEKMSE